MKRKGWKIVEKGIYKSIYNHDYQYLNQTSGKYIKYNHNKDKKVTHEVLWYNPKNYGNSTIIEDLKTGKSEKIEDVSCIAWDKKDRLVFAKMGCIYYKNFDNWDNELLYDFNSEHFTEIIAPDWAKSF